MYYPSKDEISDYLELNLTTGEYIAINNNGNIVDPIPILESERNDK